MLKWYLPRNEIEVFQFPFLLGLALGWDMCRFSDGQYGSAVFNVCFDAVLLTAIISVSRYAQKKLTHDKR